MRKFFDELMESVQQMNEIVRGERQPSREFHVRSSDRHPRIAKSGLIRLTKWL